MKYVGADQSLWRVIFADGKIEDFVIGPSRPTVEGGALILGKSFTHDADCPEEERAMRVRIIAPNLWSEVIFLARGG